MPAEHPQVPQVEVGTRLQEPMNDRHLSSWLLAMVTPSETSPSSKPTQSEAKGTGSCLDFRPRPGGKSPGREPAVLSKEAAIPTPPPTHDAPTRQENAED